jgi:DNA-binding transcriptional LysR family regulator
MDWDRIRIFLAVARTGQILGAARRLGVNHATVARQLTALEQELKTRLVGAHCSDFGNRSCRPTAIRSARISH